MVRLHKPILGPLGLTFPQYLVILELLDSGPRSVGALGAALDMDTGTITPLVKRLEAAGRLTRTRDPKDERRVVVELTPEGRALDADVRGVTEQIRSACQLTGDGLDDLRRTLDALAHSSEALS
jgi:DNA-binding MarR family transcriptional regulator